MRESGILLSLSMLEKLRRNRALHCRDSNILGDLIEQGSLRSMWGELVSTIDFPKTRRMPTPFPTAFPNVQGGAAANPPGFDRKLPTAVMHLRLFSLMNLPYKVCQFALFVTRLVISTIRRGAWEISICTYRLSARTRQVFSHVAVSSQICVVASNAAA
jgi:hypothetical protein